jgi:hypothetical protein
MRRGDLVLVFRVRLPVLSHVFVLRDVGRFFELVFHAVLGIAAVFVLLAAAAGAWIVSADFHGVLLRSL